MDRGGTPEGFEDTRKKPGKIRGYAREKPRNIDAEHPRTSKIAQESRRTDNDKVQNQVQRKPERKKTATERKSKGAMQWSIVTWWARVFDIYI